MTDFPADSLVLVTGATGGVGQLTVGALIDHKIAVRAMTRDRSKAEKMFRDRAEIVVADTRTPQTLGKAMQGVTHVICCTGTTAFPSERWAFDLPTGNGLETALAWGRLYFDRGYRGAIAQNSPQQVDDAGVKALIAAVPSSLKRFVLVSSIGIERRDQFPFVVLNAYGVLDAKAQGEAALVDSSVPYTIIRPGRLIDGPFTSYDLNTLLQATTHGKLGVVIGTGDRLNGDASRIDVAQACVACLQDTQTLNRTFELVNRGDRPDVLDWHELFAL